MAPANQSPPAPSAPQAPRPPARRRRQLARWILAGAATLVSLVLVELAYRAGWVEASVREVTPTADQYAFYQHDPLLGWANSPGATGHFTRDEFEYDVSINEHGMRQGSLARRPAPGVRRIAVLGDSFVWGIGVSDAERLTEQLEARLPATQVLNFGVSGYSSVQYALMLDEVASFSPELVIVVVCLSNDFADNVLFQRYGYFKPYAHVRSGGLEILGAPIPNVRKFGFRREDTFLGSRLLGDLRRNRVPQEANQRGLIGFEGQLVYSDPVELDEEERGLRQAAIDVQRALLAEIVTRLGERGIELLVVSAPTKREYNSTFGNEPEGHFLGAEEALRGCCADEGIAFLATAHELSPTDFWITDGHWRPSGHQKVAQLVVEWLQAEGGW